MQKIYRFVRDLVTDPILFATLLTVIIMLIAGCGAPPNEPSAAQARGGQKGRVDGDAPRTLSEPTKTRVSINDVLEVLVELPAGTVIETAGAVVPADYRDESGKIRHAERSFYSPIEVVSVPEEYRDRYPQEILDGWNSISGGLYLPLGDLQ